jgi:hypothetical protein
VKVFGDSFISGFIEGRKLDAIISIKTKNGDNSNDIKAALEANFGKGGVGGSIQGEAAVAHAKSFADTKPPLLSTGTVVAISKRNRSSGQLRHSLKRQPISPERR